MEEEFQEFDIALTESYSPEKNKIDISQFSFSDHNRYSSRNNNNNNNKMITRNNSKKKRSAPVNIRQGETWTQCIDSDFIEDEDGEVVPPHILVGRRIYARKVAYSVCTGNGRTLKGRDMREVRNSVLKMTGFLES